MTTLGIIDKLGGKTIVEVSKFWEGVNEIVSVISGAIFGFLPVGIIWSVSRKMGTSQILGIVLGICLVHPSLFSAYEYASHKAAGDVPHFILGFEKVGYQAQVIPALLAGLSLSYLEIFWRKHVPEVVSMIFVPFLSLIPALILAHTVLGPIGWTIGQALSTVVLAGLTGPVKWLFGAVFAYYIMHRHDEREAQISLPATISAYLGVTEPALFGVNVKYIYPFVAGMIGSSIAGLLSVTFNITAASIGIGGLPGILSIQPKYMISFAAIMLVAIIVPMVLTFFFRKAGLFTKTEDDTELKEEFAAQEEAEFASHTATPTVLAESAEVVSPLAGQVKPLSQATDPVFSSGVMGQGVVIEPSQGELVSPVNGTVTVLFPTKHAVGIISEEGIEMLMHIGMDTVSLDGTGFVAHVEQGDKVVVGQQLISFDMDVIKKAGLVTETPVIITNQDDFQADVEGNLPRDIKRGDALMIAHRTK